MPKEIYKLSEKIHKAKNIINDYLKKQYKKLMIILSAVVTLILIMLSLSFLIKLHKINLLIQLNKNNKVELFFNLKTNNLEFVLKSNKKFIHISTSFLLITIFSFIAILIALSVIVIYSELKKNNKTHFILDQLMEIIEYKNRHKLEANIISTIQNRISYMKKIELKKLEFIPQKFTELELLIEEILLLEINIMNSKQYKIPKIGSAIESELLKYAPQDLKTLYGLYHQLIEEYYIRRDTLMKHDSGEIKLSEKDKKDNEEIFQMVEREVTKHEKEIMNHQFYQTYIHEIFSIYQEFDQNRLNHRNQKINSLLIELAEEKDTLSVYLKEFAQYSMEKENLAKNLQHIRYK